MKVSCSICNMEFDDMDKDWPSRKSKHEGKHSNTRGSVDDPQKLIKVNNSVGIVTWVTVW